MISDGGNSDPFCVARLNSDGASKSCVNWGSRDDVAERGGRVVSRLLRAVSHAEPWIVVRVRDAGGLSCIDSEE